MNLRGDFILYKIECAINNKVYIGITTQGIPKRWSQHLSCSAHEDTKLYRSIRKHGVKNFSISHIASSWSFESLLLAEAQVISQYNSKKLGLNSTFGGDGVVGMEHDDNSRLRMSLQSKELWRAPGHKAKMSVAQKAAWARKSADEIEKRRASAKLTFSIHKPYQNHIKVEKVPLWKGKGYNMKLKTHCPSGHEYSADNTHTNRRGSRVCRLCKKLNRNKSRDKKRKDNREMLSKLRAMGLDMGGAIAQKMDYNATREDHKIENRRAEGGKAY